MDALHYTLRIRICSEKVFFGPGVSEILQRVEKTGSLRTAAGEMQMSYSKAWKIVRTAGEELGFALMERHAGGPGGGFSHLTEQGRDFLARYEAFQQEIRQAADGLFLKYFGGGGADEKDQNG